jgi:hypothetical protein
LITLRLPALNGNPEWIQLSTILLAEQEELAVLPLLPTQGEQWLKNKIEPKWKKLLTVFRAWDADREEINSLLGRLEVALRVGLNQDLARNINHLPRDLCDKWISLAYVYCTSNNLFVLEEILQLLEDPALPVPHKHQMKRVLKYLKVLVEALPEVEERANKIILSLRYGNALESETQRALDLPWECELSQYGFGEAGTSFAE